MIKHNRVVVTGMGVIAPNGIGLEAFWDSLIHGRSGIGPITLFDASNLKSRIAGEVKNFDPFKYIEPEMKPKRMARHTQFAYAAAMMALRDAGLNVDAPDIPNPTPVIIGINTSAMDIIERQGADFDRRGIRAMSPVTLGALAPQTPANTIADRIGAHGKAETISSACPSGMDAIALATNMIRSGEVEMAIAGGADAPITRYTLAAFIATGLVAGGNDAPERTSRPFDLFREAGVLAEGAGVFVVENLERAQARGAPLYLEITGHSRSKDSSSHCVGSGLFKAMKSAVANAGRNGDEIDYISAYGTGDPILDAAEVRYIKEVFRDRALEIPITSIKGVTGNPLAAGGPFQLAAGALSFRHQQIPPIANYEHPDPSCDLDFVHKRARRIPINCALINVRGLGGGASSMLINRMTC